MNLDDEALEWHQSYMKCRDSLDLPDWDEYLVALVETFSEEFSDPIQAISCFLGGLKEELVNPSSKVQLLGQSSFTMRKPSYEFVWAKLSPTNVVPTLKLALPTPRVPVASKTRRTISPTEMHAKRAQRLCYFCDDKYTHGHKCNLPKQLFVLDLEYEEEEGLEEIVHKTDGETTTEEWSVTEGDPPMISLCALSGIQGAQLFM
ncbi:uncharacterized protein [Nicotiana sylvestris]|uniref:uncharacterized protein n=1 Tax=Nicotiana sylvestris TaxID=4096 RepID=UPI00388CC86A